ncbi:CubicO group peptidase (beta-lactamase class C family) [Microbacterium resistens]|uniref:CubicO group peptidase (Beta-lactamase class C family) n=1 Tax=Microbacterium resistens TaxID=156977 RepID=A0ABU1S8Y2_9MICO|nr:serine hydrolase domain-containing protein [Microbacterium resistens]MDR6866067.1 CubicO group peptidase (beta-lactamase class C family) [Microbacterium resistens]
MRSLLLTAVLAVPLAIGLALGPEAATATASAGPDRLVQEYADVYATPGIAAAVIEDGTVTTTVRGTDGSGSPVTADTRFRIASMSKSMTATAIMLLVQDRALSLDDRVVDLLPEFRMADPRHREITVRELLEHTSGLSLRTNDEYALPIPPTMADAVAELRGRSLAADPGTRFEYHNTNYTLAARIVEEVSGQDFGVFLRERLFHPLGMDDTTSTVRCTDGAPGLAPGHSVLLRIALVVPEMPGRCGGNGGVVSTLDDMVQWIRFTAGDIGTDVLAPGLRVQMQGPRGVAAPYALGWESHPAGDGFPSPLLTHGGTLATYAGSMAIALDTGTSAIVLANGSGDPGTLARNLIADIDGHPLAPFEDPLTTFNAILLGIAIALLLLFTVLFARAKRWAVRRNTATRPMVALRLLPLVLAVIVGVFVPLLPGLLGGMIAWEYWIVDLWLYPMLVLIALVLIAGAGAVLLLRLVLLRKGRPAVRRIGRETI